MNFLLIDFDSVLHQATRCSKDLSEDGFVHDESEVYRRINLDLGYIIDGVKEEGFEPDVVKLFVSRGKTFRHILFDSYKRNRVDKEVPPLLSKAYTFAIEELNAIHKHGYEADDVVIAAKKYLERLDDSNKIVIASMDKDLKQEYGLFFDYYYNRFTLDFVDKHTAMSNFFKQLLTGDTSDNISGIHGIGVKKAEKILKECKTKFSFVRAVYTEYKKKYKGKAKEKYVTAYIQLRMTTRGIDFKDHELLF